MKRNDFNRFMEVLQNAETRRDVEHCAYIFLNLTDKQTLTVVNFYIDNQLAKIENGHIIFGYNNCYNMTVDRYNELTK